MADRNRKVGVTFHRAIPPATRFVLRVHEHVDAGGNLLVDILVQGHTGGLGEEEQGKPVTVHVPHFVVGLGDVPTGIRVAQDEPGRILDVLAVAPDPGGVAIAHKGEAREACDPYAPGVARSAKGPLIPSAGNLSAGEVLQPFFNRDARFGSDQLIRCFFGKGGRQHHQSGQADAMEFIQVHGHPQAQSNRRDGGRGHTAAYHPNRDFPWVAHRPA
jgi:hypothetical protein